MQSIFNYVRVQTWRNIYLFGGSSLPSGAVVNKNNVRGGKSLVDLIPVDKNLSLREDRAGA